MQKVNNHVRF